MLDFKFCIDTGDFAPDYCRQPGYGFHERNIMNRHISALEYSGLDVDCEGQWRCLLVLVPKPHQEEFDSIDNFIWRLCISNRRLNIITLIFEYPISRCVDSIKNLGDSYGLLWIVSLDLVAGIIRFVFAYGIVRRSLSLLPVAKIKRIHPYLSVPRTHWYSTHP